MVRFLEDPEQYKSCAMIERIDLSIERYPFHVLALNKIKLHVSELVLHSMYSRRSLIVLKCIEYESSQTICTGKKF